MSLHSLVGLAALGCGALNVASGSLKSFNGGLAWPRLLWSDKNHRFIGKLSFALLVVATALGLYNKVHACFLVICGTL